MEVDVCQKWIYLSTNEEKKMAHKKNSENWIVLLRLANHFLKADTYPAVQECYLRAMSVEQYAMPDGKHFFHH